MPFLGPAADLFIAFCLFIVGGAAIWRLGEADIGARTKLFLLWISFLVITLGLAYAIAATVPSLPAARLYQSIEIITALLAFSSALAIVIGVRERIFEQLFYQRTRELRFRAEMFALAIKGSPITVFSQDRDGKYNFIHNPPAGHEAERVVGKTDEEILPSAAAAITVPARKAALETGVPQRFEVIIDRDGMHQSFDIYVEQICDDDGAASGTLSVAYDTTVLKEHEQRAFELMREVTHRSKNLLAIIQSIARQTAVRATSIEDFLSRFSARVAALGKAHDLLVQDEWAGASVKDLVASQLSPFSSTRGGEVAWEGPQLLLRADAAQNIALALHELAANAAKYGALSSPSGRVAISWAMTGGATDKAFQLNWRETGGPPVGSPDGAGFGRLMLEHVVGQALQGKVALRFEPEGICCVMTIPASHVAGYAQPAA